MDARTFVDTQVVGHQLGSKRQRAAEERLAGKARQEAAASARTRGLRWFGSTRLVTRVVALVIAALLAALLVGEASARQPDGVARGGGSIRRLLCGGSVQDQLVTGRGPASKLLLMRGGGASNTHHLNAYRGLDRDKHDTRARLQLLGHRKHRLSVG